MSERLTTDPGYRLEYIVGHEAWYADANKMADPDPYVGVIKAHEEGGCDWEFQIVDRAEGVGKPSLQVQIYDDAFAALVELAPLLATFADERPTTLADAREILDRFGFTDVTSRTSPYGTERAMGEVARLRAKSAELAAVADRIESGAGTSGQ